ncbi:MAG: hypothetical protein AB2L20_09725 [Mangrovibacterium sp.]
MERLIKSSQRKTDAAKTGFKRFLYTEIDWNQPLTSCCKDSTRQVVYLSRWRQQAES